MCCHLSPPLPGVAKMQPPTREPLGPFRYTLMGIQRGRREEKDNMNPKEGYRSYMNVLHKTLDSQGVTQSRAAVHLNISHG